MSDRKVIAWRPSFPALKDILGSTQADILCDLLADYAYKTKKDWNGPEYFSIRADMYFRRTYTAILQYVSITKENLSKNMKSLKDKELIYIKDRESTKEVTSYKINVNSSKYIELAKEKLETVKNKYTRLRIEEFIEILERDPIVINALGIDNTFFFKGKEEAPLDNSQAI